MTTETSIGAIIFNKDRQVLLLKRADKEDYWEFPKGHIKADEAESTALKRELKEECNICKPDIISDFREEDSYTNSKGNKRIFIIYLTKTKEQITLSKEHIEFKWLSQQEAIKKLNHEKWSAMLNKAYDKIN